jgi:hypothetical protein
VLGQNPPLSASLVSASRAFFQQILKIPTLSIVDGVKHGGVVRAAELSATQR